MPFYSHNKFELMNQIEQCDWSFNVGDWESISQEARLFIKAILVKNPKKRMNLKMMLRHCWMQTEEANVKMFKI